MNAMYVVHISYDKENFGVCMGTEMGFVMLEWKRIMISNTDICFPL